MQRRRRRHELTTSVLELRLHPPYDTDAAERLEAVVDHLCGHVPARARVRVTMSLTSRCSPRARPSSSTSRTATRGRVARRPSTARSRSASVASMPCVVPTWNGPFQFSSRWFPSRRLTPTQPRVAVRRLVMGAAGAPNAHAMSGSSTRRYGSNVTRADPAQPDT